MNKFIKTVDRNSLTHEFLMTLNGLLKLTDREIDVMSILLDITIDKRHKFNQLPIDNTKIRKYIVEVTGIGRDNLCRYLQRFKSKKLIIKTDKREGYKINSAIVPIIIGGKTVQTTLILKIKENEV